ncbi:SDR family oxidoreductase [Tetragenococcus osmophilus]|nr:SDR family oxidoreductase [Tetragenococcus osmophilus]
MGRYGKPEEFAKVAAFLVSGANTYLTGQNLLVDGGKVKAI